MANLNGIQEDVLVPKQQAGLLRQRVGHICLLVELLQGSGSHDAQILIKPVVKVPHLQQVQGVGMVAWRRSAGTCLNMSPAPQAGTSAADCCATHADDEPARWGLC